MTAAGRLSLSPSVSTWCDTTTAVRRRRHSSSVLPEARLTRRYLARVPEWILQRAWELTKLSNRHPPCSLPLPSFPVISLAASAGVASSSIAPLSSSPSLSLSSASLSLASLSSTSLSPLSSVSSPSPSATSSDSISLASSSSTLPFSPSSSTSPSPSASTSSAASISHGARAAFYATIALGTLILIACIAAVVACLIRIRIRIRRREAATISTIGWDPVVLDHAKEATTATPDLSLVGGRDVGEPKCAESFLVSGRTHTDSYRCQPPPFDTMYQAPMTNPFVETAYYSPHQVALLVNSTAYPLPPPHPALTMTIPLSNGRPYPTAPAPCAPRRSGPASYQPPPESKHPYECGRGCKREWEGVEDSGEQSVRERALAFPQRDDVLCPNGSAPRASTDDDPQAQQQAVSLPLPL
ncbi:hypothetical protein C8R45DRAFT_541980 [Mycena sanguinolenta]|nr:hypothetical protein C8R45DRAFT_541980 [Mycena sanguinolenta]